MDSALGVLLDGAAAKMRMPPKTSGTWKARQPRGFADILSAEEFISRLFSWKKLFIFVIIHLRTSNNAIFFTPFINIIFKHIRILFNILHNPIIKIVASF